MPQPRSDQRPVPRKFESRRVRVILCARMSKDTHVPIRAVDLTELDLPSTMKTQFPNPADLLNFTLTITPDEGTFLL